MGRRVFVTGFMVKGRCRCGWLWSEGEFEKERLCLLCAVFMQDESPLENLCQVLRRVENVRNAKSRVSRQATASAARGTLGTARES